MDMERIKISELPKASDTKGIDNVLILQDGITKTVTMNLISQNIKGQTGATGPAGKNGTNGKEIELQKGSTNIEWKYKGTDSWTPLIAINELKGDKGESGSKGTDGVRGLPGKDGVTPNIQIGTVSTLDADQQATVTNRGTKEAPVLDFGIPKGATGPAANLELYQKKNDSSLSTSDKDIVGAINELLNKINSIEQRLQALEAAKG